MPFRYSGSKHELLEKIRHPPIGSRKIVEPFAGSARYGIYHCPEKLYLYEANTDIHELWRWLIDDASSEDLVELEKKRAIVTRNVRELNLDKARETLMRLTCTGVYVGQLCSWVMYPQHRVDFSQIADLIPWIKSNIVLGGTDFRDSIVHDDDDDVMYFIDPPYLGTSGCYIDKSTKINHDNVLSSEEIADFVCSIKSPTIFTYGTDAPETFPMFKWHRMMEKSVPRIKNANGTSRTRTEWAAYINFKNRLPDGSTYAA